MNELEVGKSVKDRDVRRWVDAAASGLAHGEQILGLYRVNQFRPSADVGFVTTARIILADTALGAFEFKTEYRIAEVVQVTANKMGMNGQVAITTSDGKKAKIAVGRGLSAKADAVAVAALVERAKQHPEHASVSASLPDPTPDARRHAPTVAPEPTLSRPNAKLEAKKQELEGRLEARREERTQFRKEPVVSPLTPPLALNADVTIGDRLTTKATKVILEHCMPDEQPWLVITSSGAGVMAAFEDRLMIIKTGAITSWMAGSMGGGRSATFHYSDITGIEYNSGLMNGVLEVLTPSYSGTVAKDYWRGSSSSRNADASDPHTLSNTLPLTRQHHTQAQPHLNDLRSRISAAKRPTAAPPQQALVASSSLASQLADLAALRQTGVLTEEEFVAAKAKTPELIACVAWSSWAGLRQGVAASIGGKSAHIAAGDRSRPRRGG